MILLVCKDCDYKWNTLIHFINVSCEKCGSKNIIDVSD